MYISNQFFFIISELYLINFILIIDSFPFSKPNFFVLFHGMNSNTINFYLCGHYVGGMLTAQLIDFRTVIKVIFKSKFHLIIRT